jgi:DNA processing protein
LSDNSRVDTYRWKTPEALLGPLDEVERKHAPGKLWFAGDESLLTHGARVSIVGSRKASELGLNRAARLARLLVERGVTVVSGLAEGIDGAAHTEALRSKGRTVAVLGTPLDKTFPAMHRDLQAEIIRNHLAVSQFATGCSTTRASFPMRNRTMALVSDATVIIEAGAKSGTIHQGWEALRLGRALYILESLTQRGFDWVDKLRSHGAQVLSDNNREEFMDSLPEESRIERFAQPPF